MAELAFDGERSVAERARRAALLAFAWCVVCFLLAPNVIVVGMSFSRGSTLEFPPQGFSLRWYQRYLETPGWIEATATSLLVGVATAALSVVIGGLAAYALARGRFRGRELGQALILLPIIVPHLVVAIALYRLFSGLGLTGTYAGFVLAHTMLATPFVVTIMVPTIRSIDPALEHAAIGLGAGRLQTLRRVTIPLALPGIVSSALFAFLVSFDELLVAMFLSGPFVATLPKKLWDGVRLEIEPTLAAVSTLLIVLTLAILMAAALARIWGSARSASRERAARES